MRTPRYLSFENLKVSDTTNLNLKQFKTIVFQLTDASRTYELILPDVMGASDISLIVHANSNGYEVSNGILSKFNTGSPDFNEYNSNSPNNIITVVYTEKINSLPKFTITLLNDEVVPSVSIPELTINNYNSINTLIDVSETNGEYTVSNVKYSNNFTFESSGSLIPSPFQDGTFPDTNVEFKLTDTSTSEVWFFRFKGYKYVGFNPFGLFGTLEFLNSISVIKDINGTPQENANAETFFDDNIVNPWDLVFTDFKIYAGYTDTQCYANYQVLN